MTQNHNLFSTNFLRKPSHSPPSEANVKYMLFDYLLTFRIHTNSQSTNWQIENCRALSHVCIHTRDPEERYRSSSSFSTIIKPHFVNVAECYCDPLYQISKRKRTNVNFRLKTSFLLSSSRFISFCAYASHVLCHLRAILFYFPWMQWECDSMREMAIMWWAPNKQPLLINFSPLIFTLEIIFIAYYRRSFGLWSYKRCYFNLFRCLCREGKFAYCSLWNKFVV